MSEAPVFPRPFGRYTLLSNLAQGGMGALYLACQGETDMEKLCVVKTVLPQLADRQYIGRFRDEAKVVVYLQHGNLVPVFDAGIVKTSGSDELYLAMEHVDGKDLRAVWNRCAKKGIAFPVDIAVYIARELARGLYHAHTFDGMKLVHRDVSPPNVLLSYSGEVKLTDFGLAASSMKTERTAPGIIYGKVSYMSPEQAHAEALDGRSDLYSVAIILFELLTGRQLFPQGTSDLIEKVRNPTLVAPSQLAPRVPPALDEIVLKALAKDREQRYGDCEQFRAALSGFLAQTAPTTDNARVADFLRQLFGEDIEKERAERQRLLAELPRQRAQLKRRKEDAQLTPIAISGGDAKVVTPNLSTESGLIGKFLDNRYLVKRLIGEGGMGFVYEAEHVEIGRRVAIKVLHALYARQSEVVARFRSEAKAATKIGHPHIIDVTDSGTTPEGAAYIVMEYLDGQNLHELLSKVGALTVPRAIAIGREICQALEAAHQAGILHRDMKPENVFLIQKEGRADFVKVLDFGIAKSLDQVSEKVGRLTNPGVAMGTPEYMAPEQAAGGVTDARADVYAVGAIIYEMLTNRPPHEGAHVMEVLQRKATMKPVALREINSSVPASLEALVSSALSIVPDERPQSMDAFQRSLSKISDQLTAPDGDLEVPNTLKVGDRRRSYMLAGLGAGAMVIAFTALSVAMFMRPSHTSSAHAPPETAVLVPKPEPPKPPPIVAMPPPQAVVAPAHTVAPTLPARSEPAKDAKRLLDQARAAMSQGQFGQADELFKRVRALGVYRGQALTGLAESAFQRGKAADALLLARQAVEAGGGVPAKMVLGNAYFKLARYDDAIGVYREVLKTSKNHVEAQRNLQLAEKRRGL